MVSEMTSLNLYFDELRTVAYEEEPTFSSLSLIAGIGGYFGLFLGCSIITFLEFFEFGFVWAFGLHRKGP